MEINLEVAVWLKTSDELQVGGGHEFQVGGGRVKTGSKSTCLALFLSLALFLVK